MQSGLRQGWFGKPTGTAAEDRIKTGHCTLLVPQACPVGFAGQDTSLAARFSGRLKMTGTWHFGWIDDETFDLVFTPDAATEATLPHWKGCDANVITFENPHDVLRLILTQRARSRLRLRRQLTVHGQVTITVDRLVTAFADGWPTAQVRFLEIETPLQAVAPAAA